MMKGFRPTHLYYFIFILIKQLLPFMATALSVKRKQPSAQNLFLLGKAKFDSTTSWKVINNQVVLYLEPPHIY